MYRYIDVYGMFIGTLCPSLAPIVCLGLALALSPPASLPPSLPPTPKTGAVGGYLAWAVMRVRANKCPVPFVH